MIASSSVPACTGINEAGSPSPGFRLPYLCLSVLTQALLELLPMCTANPRGWQIGQALLPPPTEPGELGCDLSCPRPADAGDNHRHRAEVQ